MQIYDVNVYVSSLQLFQAFFLFLSQDRLYLR